MNVRVVVCLRDEDRVSDAMLLYSESSINPEMAGASQGGMVALDGPTELLNLSMWLFLGSIFKTFSGYEQTAFIKR